MAKKECTCGYSIGHPLVPKCTCKPTEWVSLTDEEISECAMQGYASEMAKAIITGVVKVGDANIQIAKAVEAKLKEKNT